jgi:DNA helicase II / ATP-dependent DNA helicase PcrA
MKVMEAENILRDLNPQQKEAVAYDKGPLLIIAGAGTGKTRVITRRVAYLIASGKAQSDQILALTFTDKAAGEMEERVDILVPYGYVDIWISTFHAFGERVLKERAIEIGLDPDFKVLTRPEQMIFIKEHLFQFPLDYYRPLGNPARFVEALVTVFSRARDEDISPQEYVAYAEELEKRSRENLADRELAETAKKEKEIALSYKKYQELKFKEGLVDFGDQFHLVLKLFREHPSVLREYQRQFKYILVDEFQDTNYAQFELVKLLADKHKNITVSADDDQSIYKFRGAAISNVLGFINTYKKAKKIVITKNYRSPQPILDCAYRLIKNNNPDRLEVKTGVNKKLEGRTKKGKKPEHLHYDAASYEADQVAEIIKKKVKDGEYNYQDFAILVRSNNDAQSFLQAMNMEGIPWRFTGNQGLYSQSIIRLVTAFLRIISNLSDSISLYYLASSEIYKISMDALTQCANYSSRKNKSLYQVLKKIDSTFELSDLNEEEIDKIKRLTDDLDKFLEASRTLSTGNILYKFLNDTGFLKSLTEQESEEAEEKIKNLAKFFEIVKNFGLLTEHDRASTFVSHLDLLISAGDDPAVAEADIDVPAVNVLTIHKAKGLEFPVVFMVSLVMNKFPWPKRKEPIELPEELVKDILPIGDFFIQEERRLFYVGMTRAKDLLYLTSARDYGGRRPRKVSIFILEALNLSKTEFEPYKSKAVEVIKRHAPREKAPEIKTTPSQDRMINLSPYKIDDYLTCPLKYKYIHILRVPILKHHTVIYGKILHNTVAEYFRRKLNNQKVTVEDLLAYYKNIWNDEGYLTKEHEEERLKTAEQTIRKFFEREEKINKLPTSIEEDFKIIIGNTRISGRWDRLDEHDGESVIIDYKSSEINDQKKADRKTKNSLQLDIYALAYKEKKGRLPDKVQLHFLETGLIGSDQKTPEDIEKVIEKIEEVSSVIRKGNFQAQPVYRACDYCPYSQICHYTVSAFVSKEKGE